MFIYIDNFNYLKNFELIIFYVFRDFMRDFKDKNYFMFYEKKYLRLVKMCLYGLVLLFLFLIIMLFI